MKKALQWFLWLFGAIAIFIAALHIVLGPASIPGSVAVNPTMDSEDRFYAVLFAAYGVALIWCTRDIEKKSGFVHFLSATFFAGGVARLISFVAVGPPNELFLAMTALELLIPVYMSLAQRRIARDARSGEVIEREESSR